MYNNNVELIYADTEEPCAEDNPDGKLLQLHVMSC